MTLSPFELEIFQNVLSSIAEEMGMSLIRAGFSPNIKERRDLSCAIFDQKGEMIAQAAHIPVHLGSMSFAVKAILDQKEILEGDIFIINDPFNGGTHLPDITCIAPVFVNSKVEFFVASRAHHADVGGITPGSMPLSTHINQEGVLIPPTKLYKKGRLQTRIMANIINSTRDPEEREGDFKAQIAALEIGISRLKQVIKKYSLKKIKQAGQELLNYSEKIMRNVIRDIPNGNYSFKDFLDDDGAGTKTIPINVKVIVKQNKVVVDFRGSSPTVRGCVNTPFSVTTSAVLYCFQCLAPPEIPLNSGPLRLIKIVADNNSILNAKYPSAVAGGNVETSQRVVDVVFGALSNAIPQRVPAASPGTMSNITFGGILKSGKNYAYYETIGGGMGARYGIRGVNALQTHMTNTLNTPIESLERELPILIEEYSIRRNSGGKGMYNGGDGITRSFNFLSNSTVTLITERRNSQPYGINGGNKGKRGINNIIKNNTAIKLSPKISLQVKKNEIVKIETPGGGAWGKPIKKK